MPDKKLTDSEIVKALECCADYKNTKCKGCPLEESCVDNNICGLALDLINRLQAENKSQSIMIKMLKGSIEDYKNSYINQKAENERLKPFEEKIAEYNSHIRVENMLVFASSLEEWLEFMQKTKTEAYKEFAEKLQKKLDPTLIAITKIGCVLVDVSKSHISSDIAVEKIREYLSNLEIETRLSFDMAVCDLLKEMVGEQPILNDVKCIDCEYLELELPYAVCSKAHKGIVAPDDSCGKGKLKETVGEDNV